MEYFYEENFWKRFSHFRFIKAFAGSYIAMKTSVLCKMESSYTYLS